MDSYMGFVQEETRMQGFILAMEEWAHNARLWQLNDIGDVYSRKHDTNENYLILILVIGTVARWRQWRYPSGISFNGECVDRNAGGSMGVYVAEVANIEGYFLIIRVTVATKLKMSIILIENYYLPITNFF